PRARSNRDFLLNFCPAVISDELWGLQIYTARVLSIEDLKSNALIGGNAFTSNVRLKIVMPGLHEHGLGHVIKGNIFFSVECYSEGTMTAVDDTGVRYHLHIRQFLDLPIEGRSGALFFEAPIIDPVRLEVA